MTEWPVEACMAMYGEHIRLCIKDYAYVHKHSEGLRKRVDKPRKRGSEESPRLRRLHYLLRHYDGAKHFLFEGGLEDAIDRFSLPLNAEYVRNYATKAAKEGGLDERGQRRTLNEIIEDCVETT